MAIETGLRGRTILITGAGRNIGRLAALAFAREGTNLAICTRSSMEALDRVADEARALGARVMARQCDVSDAQAVEAFVEKARAEFGAVDVAINNAVYRSEAESKGFLDQPLEAWRRNLQVNLEGPYNVCRAVLPLMKEGRWGRIISFSGATAYLGAGAARAAVRLGVVALMVYLASENAGFITGQCYAINGGAYFL